MYNSDKVFFEEFQMQLQTLTEQLLCISTEIIQQTQHNTQSRFFTEHQEYIHAFTLFPTPIGSATTDMNQCLFSKTNKCEENKRTRCLESIFKLILTAEPAPS
jgi:hypothetical protein